MIIYQTPPRRFAPGCLVSCAAEGKRLTDQPIKRGRRKPDQSRWSLIQARARRPEDGEDGGASNLMRIRILTLWRSPSGRKGFCLDAHQEATPQPPPPRFEMVSFFFCTEHPANFQGTGLPQPRPYPSMVKTWELQLGPDPLRRLSERVE